MTRYTPQKILHISLDSDIPDLYPVDNFPILYVVAWWHNIPLGHLSISKHQLPMSASRFKQLLVQSVFPSVNSYLQKHTPSTDSDLIINSVVDADDFLKRWESPFSQLCQLRSAKVDLTISLVICTRDRPDSLKACLRSLQASSELPDEIIIVDNAPSTDLTHQIVSEIQGVKYVLEPSPGLDIARNTGILHSSSDIVAYTDDDVLVHSDWIFQLRRAFVDPEIVAVTGLVCAAELETRPQYIFERHWSFNRGYQCLTFDRAYFDKYSPVGVPAWRIGAGANMAFRRSVFKIVGFFDERLDVGAAGCSGDSEIWYRTLAEGLKCRYDPSAVVFHVHRRDMESLKRQLFFYMRGHVAELLIRFERYKHWGNLVRLTLLPVYFFYLFLLGWTRGPYRYSTIPSEIRGCLSGFKFYLLNMR